MSSCCPKVNCESSPLWTFFTKILRMPARSRLKSSSFPVDDQTGYSSMPSAKVTCDSLGKEKVAFVCSGWLRSPSRERSAPRMAVRAEGHKPPDVEDDSSIEVWRSSFVVAARNGVGNLRVSC